MNKRGTIGALGIIILLFAAGLIFFFWISSLTDSWEDNALARTCFESVETKDTALNIEGFIDDAIPLGIYDPSEPGSGLKCFTQSNEIKTSNELEIKQELAQSMLGCYDQFGQCEKNPFGLHDNTYCFICSINAFEHKDLEIQEFQEYLDTTFAPGKGGLTYSEYFDSQQLDIILTENNQAIVYSFEYNNGPGECGLILTDYTEEGINALDCTYIMNSLN